MKSYLAAALMIFVSACTTGHSKVSNLDSYILLQNIGGPFISGRLAERLARSIIEEKYSPSTFSIKGAGKVVDHGDSWWVTFENSLDASGGTMVALRLTVHIRKTNGEIITVSG